MVTSLVLHLFLQLNCLPNKGAIIKMTIISSIFSSISYVFNLPEHIIEPISFLPDFLKDALIDSINLVPFLFLMFVFIEWIEIYFTKKRHLFVFFMKKIGPLFGSLFASIPQCGFSVIASTLYSRRILSRGTLLSVYLATSDEAIPILISEPSKAYIVLPILLIKIIVAILVGYIVDLIFTYKANEPKPLQENTKPIEEDGCCHHNLAENSSTKALWIHPIRHTFNIFIFILIVSIGLGYILSIAGTEETLAKYCLINSPLQPIITSFIGLIPNCAISVMLTLLYLKHTISFGSLIAGLSSSAGLGLLILLTKNNDKKDSAIIIAILIVTSSILGLIIQHDILHINFMFKFLGITL